jgi:NADPH-dependent glutamate synthase beta subunit-like oxidoreductase
MQPFKLRSTDSAEWFRANIKCQAACPVHTEAFAYVSALAEGDHEEAYAIARRPNPFPFICGRVCAHPCEQACRRGDIDEPISIRALKRVATDSHDMRLGHAAGLEQLPKRDEPVAIIGSGPAGMACAHDLARLGYPVTVFEAASVPGGMLSLGIPEYRLPRETVQLEIDEILKLGVDLKCNQALGTTFLLQDLKAQGYKAVFLAIGAHRSKDLRLEGMDLDGVLKGVEFLLNVNLGFRVWLGHRVVVIGGGNVAVDVARTAAREGTDRVAVHTTMDVARAARRLGSREIHVVCLESRDEMPAHGYEIEEAEREGIIFHPSIGPKRVLGVSGKVVGLETLKCLSVFDAEGRFRPRFQEGSESVITADSIILSVGQSSDLSFLREGDGVKTTPRGTIEINPETLATSAPGIFAGGDVAFGPRLIIDATADGRKAARSIHQYLRGNVHWEERIRLPIVQLRSSYDSYEATLRQACPSEPIERRIGFAEVELPFSAEAAAIEGNRCLHCHQNIFLDGERCILCGGCVDICPYRCIGMISADHVDWSDVAGDFPEEAGRGEGYAMVMDETHCIRCGLCVQRCPTAAITMRAFEATGEWVYV